jgi:hypothetical protein
VGLNPYFQKFYLVGEKGVWLGSVVKYHALKPVISHLVLSVSQSKPAFSNSRLYLQILLLGTPVSLDIMEAVAICPCK